MIYIWRMKKFNFNDDITFYPSLEGVERMKAILEKHDYMDNFLDLSWDSGNQGYTMSLWQFIHLFHPLVYHGTKAFDTMKIKLHKH